MTGDELNKILKDLQRHPFAPKETVQMLVDEINRLRHQIGMSGLYENILIKERNEAYSILKEHGLMAEVEEV